MGATERNLVELKGSVDHGLPRTGRFQSTVPTFLDGAAGRVVISEAIDPDLPFFKIWCSVTPTGTAAGWVYRAELRLKHHGRVVDKLTMDVADQTQAMAAGTAPAVSDFLSGVGTPNADSILFNGVFSGAGAVALSPRHFVGVYDRFEVAFLEKSLCTGAYVWLRIDQSNYRF